MGKKAGGQGTQATIMAAKAGVRFWLHPYGSDAEAGNYGEAAADALGIPHDRIFKTLIADVDGALTVAVVPVSASLDLKALAAAVGGKKASMADPKAAERCTGYVVGGISPLGQRKALRTVVDESATALETVYVSAGRRGLQIELAPTDLIALTRAETARIQKPH